MFTENMKNTEKYKEKKSFIIPFLEMRTLYILVDLLPFPVCVSCDGF